MKIKPIILSFFFFSFAFPTLVSAGLVVTSGDVSLKAGESKRLCEFYVYNTLEEEAVFTVKVTGDSAKFVSKIEPEEILVRSLNEVCPRENGELRRECLLNLCRQANYTYCGGTCITFSAPLTFSWEPKWQIYKGGITATTTIGATKLTDALPFNVNIMPISMTVLIATIIVIIIIVLIILLKLRKKLSTLRRRRKK